MHKIEKPVPALLSAKIQSNSCHCGLRLTAIRLPEQCTLLGILRGDHIIPVDKNPPIHAGDFVLAMAFHPMLVSALNAALKKVHPVYYSLNDCSLNSKPEINARSYR